MLATTLPMGNYQMALAPFGLTSFAAAQAPVYSGSVLPTLPPVSPGERGHGAALSIGDQVDQSNDGSAGGHAVSTGAEPGAVAAGVVTRDVFGLDDPTVQKDLSEALTNLSSAADLTLVNDADNELWLDMPTIPLFEEPIDIVHSSAVRGVSESPTWAGVFWDAQSWEIQESPPVLPSSLPPVSVQASGS